jgi:hypothetical protein
VDFEKARLDPQASLSILLPSFLGIVQARPLRDEMLRMRPKTTWDC